MMKDKINIYQFHNPADDDEFELGEATRQIRDEVDNLTKLDFSKISNIEFDQVDHNDYPDYCDAYICSADYNDRELTQNELDEVNENRDFVYEQLIKYLY
ncbi:MAG TPA: hypothetical protein VMV77_09025 [Bacteroidales bacterium]|nr:hypothetical protein [Bacteroidales bacterium]